MTKHHSTAIRLQATFLTISKKKKTTKLELWFLEHLFLLPLTVLVPKSCLNLQSHNGKKKKKSNLRERREMFKMLHSPLRSTEHIIMLLSRNDLDPLILMREKISSSRNILALTIKGTSGLPRWLNGRVNLPKQETQVLDVKITWRK